MARRATAGSPDLRPLMMARRWGWNSKALARQKRIPRPVKAHPHIGDRRQRHPRRSAGHPDRLQQRSRQQRRGCAAGSPFGVGNRAGRENAMPSTCPDGEFGACALIEPQTSATKACRAFPPCSRHAWVRPRAATWPRDKAGHGLAKRRLLMNGYKVIPTSHQSGQNLTCRPARK